MIQASNSMLNTVVAPDLKVTVNSFPLMKRFPRQMHDFWPASLYLLTAVTFLDSPSFQEKWSP